MEEEMMPGKSEPTKTSFFYQTLGILLIVGLIIGATLVFQSMMYNNILGKRQAESRQYLLSTAQRSIEALTEEIMKNASGALAGKQDSLADVQDLKTYLANVAVELENIAITDRSSSLDGVFEKFSMLVGIVTLIFGGFGIFTGLQYSQGLKEMRTQIRNYKSDSKNIMDEIKEQSQEFEASLYDAIDRSMDMIWFFGNSLERFINMGVVTEKEASQFLDDLYKVGFRFELRSLDPNERMSAIQNLWAQGDCEDLDNLRKVWKNENEPENIRKLAWMAIENILKRCKHTGGHPDLFT
jgi:hypothetical protein